ncbi:MAG: hypothetical protein HYX51_08750 [Chloroflexi bacterium]|nr:hypothetical protein [Chloroflexota bacterium]
MIGQNGHTLGPWTGEAEGNLHGDTFRREHLVFTSVSNVLKTRHDTAKNSTSD